MKLFVFLLSLFLLFSCQESPKIDLNDFLIGGSWCGKSQMAGANVCLEFMEDKVLVKVEGGDQTGDYFQYSIIEMDYENQRILWEIRGEGLVNVFKLIDENTVELTLEDFRMEPSRFLRTY
jgi:hypothetical protein